MWLKKLPSPILDQRKEERKIKLDAILEAVKTRASVTSPAVTSQLSKVHQAIALFSQKVNFNLEQRVAINIYTDHLFLMDEDEQAFYLQKLLYSIQQL